MYKLQISLVLVFLLLLILDAATATATDTAFFICRLRPLLMPPLLSLDDNLPEVDKIVRGRQYQPPSHSFPPNDDDDKDDGLFQTSTNARDGI